MPAGKEGQYRSADRTGTLCSGMLMRSIASWTMILRLSKSFCFPVCGNLGLALASSIKNTFSASFQAYRGGAGPLIFQLPDKVTSTSFGRNVHTSIVRGRHQFLASPEQCARDYVFGFVKDLWRAHGFPVFGVEMAADVVLGFVQQYYRWLDLPPDADEYCIEDLRRAFGPGLSRSTAVAAARMAPDPSGIRIIDLDSALNRPALASQVGDEGTARPYVVIAKRVPVRPALASLALISTNDIRTITRRFRAHDLEYQPPPNNFIWSCYSRQRESENASAILSRVLSEYEVFVHGNGFHLENSPYLDRTVSVLFEYRPSDRRSDPEIHEWHVHDPHRTLQKTAMLDPDPTRPSHAVTLTVASKSFPVIRTVTRSADFLFMPCPLSNFVYRLLAGDLKTQYQRQVG